MSAVANQDLVDRLAGAVWGHLVGDAVGVPYEFRPASSIHDVHFGADPGRHGQPAGTWSDDGALMLALLDSLLSVGFDTEDQGHRAVAWRDRKAYTPDGDGLFDMGRATGAAIQALSQGTPAEDAGPADEMSGGNGSLMRILPLALVERRRSATQLVDMAHRASRVTHGHERPQVACALYSLIAQRLLTGHGSRTEILAEAQANLRQIYSAKPAWTKSRRTGWPGCAARRSSSL